MKTLSYLKSLAVLALGVCLAAPVLKAIPLNFDTSGVGYYSPASQANNNTEATQAANDLVNWYNGGANPTTVTITFTLDVGTGVPAPNLPSPLTFGYKDETSPFDSINSTQYSYVLGKYGNVAYLFYLGNLAPGVYELPATLGGNGLSHEILFNSASRVPDGGVTMALLGFGLVGVALLQRKLKLA